ncbi:DUF3039 domain-containing protein [Frigoribacterium sp. Leaf44]|uniref:DUF3039 domain-containing protein n=1 Tax=Frigoribacterium sp. Leaf44 TaxID=1736220 RepID=UPI0009E7D6AD|nr:DUF3039 domain-containing protein [Frigoribacterium sp. Leaf44]
MRKTRPTLRVIKAMPDAPAVLRARDVIQRAKSSELPEAILEELRLETVRGALLDDADQRFADGGVPDRHVEATAAYHAPVYEVRDPSGAGWRGAIILDDAGDPWLVHVDAHNKFHASVAKALKRDKGKLLTTGETAGAAKTARPTDLDMWVRDSEEDRLRDHALTRELISGLRDALRAAFKSEEPFRTDTPPSPAASGSPSTFAYTVSTQHEDSAKTVAHAHETMSTITITMPKSPKPYSMYERLLSHGIIYLQSDTSCWESVYTHDELRVDVFVTHAKLAQLLSDAEIDPESFPPMVSPPTELHHVRSHHVIEGLVTGTAVQGLCGRFFVPSTSESANLPVCTVCEEMHPFAQELLDQLRERAQS